MILLDTHIWVWWVNGDPALSSAVREVILANEESGLGISLISCWEVAKKAGAGRMDFSNDVDNWLEGALAYPGVQTFGLSLPILLEATRLPEKFHKDPADQLIVATSRMLDIPLLTADGKILAYRHVQCLPLRS